MNKSDANLRVLTKEEVLNAKAEDYMNFEQQLFFKNLLLDLHDTTTARIVEAKDRMMRPAEFSDPSDRASWEEQSSIALRIVDREQKLLPKIHQALERIRLGTYGYCLESGEPIGVARLMIRPTAEYSAEVKSIKEIKEHRYRH